MTSFTLEITHIDGVKTRTGYPNLKKAFETMHFTKKFLNVKDVIMIEDFELHLRNKNIDYVCNMKFSALNNDN